MKNILRIIGVLLAASAALVVIPNAPAQADNGCPGTRDSWRQYRDSAGTIAAVLQSYDTADGVCINLVSKNQYAGVSKYMSLRVCDEARANCVTDSGNFASYAGPIYRSLPCVTVRSTMRAPNGTLIMDNWSIGGSCN
ncbi:hypothetical protein [Pimelobacter simplex]|uniref:hypothetical protein n=1 Tax=Nocardioides simplex TaxID=2045 RepID=UPI002150624E|nr:hypothetical protein [Pimelobacter simplex]UUW90965.1 hypothetical protein M0M43_05635 [Pimelobacter simplex]UUW94794.1 hypothetical protein M0M48_24140 [Pimelobacter simplex]